MPDLITLNSAEIVPKKQYSGYGSFGVAAEQSLKIETSPSGVDILDVQCPEGKVWMATITVTIEETNA